MFNSRYEIRTTNGATNSFIEPIVEELREAWHGFSLKSYKSKTPVIFKLALLCVGCDIPASRKLCGF